MVAFATEINAFFTWDAYVIVEHTHKIALTVNVWYCFMTWSFQFLVEMLSWLAFLGDMFGTVLFGELL